MERPQLHNVTVYVNAFDFERMRAFYVALFHGEVVWEEPGHIVCVGTDDLALCVHEAERDHPAGTREFFLHARDLDRLVAALEATGADVRRSASAADEIHCVDPVGNHIRIPRRRA
jgi:predicted enzyme related to lactoylglutathione lyase